MTYINLDRKFSQIIPDDSLKLNAEESIQWSALLQEYRCVVLAEAGAGKTLEFKKQAEKLEQARKFSFFIRIEDIDNELTTSFEVGDESLFLDWISSTDDAWFFLDSVDEARLRGPKEFQSKIKKFVQKVKSAAQRCHVYISSRPYSWRYTEDATLLDSELFFPLDGNTDKSSLKVYQLNPLKYEDIQQFCQQRSVHNIAELINEIKRFDLLSLAERPFDLDNIILKWRSDNKLDSRLNIIKYNIEQRLRERHTLDRKSNTINFEKLYEGAQRLAAAVILMRNMNIATPSSMHDNDKVINASTLLPDWNNEEVTSLLQSGIFNDILYDAVSFRHRDIREFLASQWFFKLLNGDDRLSVEKLFFREQFDKKIIVPTLRPLLPWLAVLDDKICKKVIQYQPEIIFESGDPSQLSLEVRKQVLSKYIDRIVNNKDGCTISYNSAVTKIANADLETLVVSLINQYIDNDNAIFFLAQMAWQGRYTQATTTLKLIALDSSRDVYLRRISIRAIIGSSNDQNKYELWTDLNKKKPLDRKLIAELVSEIEPDESIIRLLIDSLQIANDKKQYQYDDLNQSLTYFIQKCEERLIFELLIGIEKLLRTQPCYRAREYELSKQYAWTLDIAFKIIEKLVKERSDFALEKITINILIDSIALKYHEDFSVSIKSNYLESNIPMWEQLNDKLYWCAIDRSRKYIVSTNNGGRLLNDFNVCDEEHFWEFNDKSLDRLLNYLDEKTCDDQIVIINRAFAIYNQKNKCVDILEKIQEKSTNYPDLKKHVNSLLNPVLDDTYIEDQQKWKDIQLLREKERAETIQSRLDWINRLKNNPEQIFNTPATLNAQLSNNHVWLMNSIEKKTQSHSAYANWGSLIPEFGENVANAYKDSAKKFWRIYKPKLYSEDSNLKKNSTPDNLIFGLAGLEIEFSEDLNFFKKLNDNEINNAIRYITWDSPGFPSWFEKLYQLFPNKVIEAINKELVWEFESAAHDIKNSYNHVIQDIFYHTPWLHNDIAPKILDWLKKNSPVFLHKDQRTYAVQILINSTLGKENFILLAKQMVAKSNSNEQKAWWYALYVDSDPQNGILSLTNWLKSLPEIDAVNSAQIFVCHLLGKIHAINGRAGDNEFKKIKYLKMLHALMNKYIKIEEDLHRANTGAYSPTLRDNAQDARDLLFKYLKEIPCAESYHAIQELSKETICETRRIWLERIAYDIALSCGDIDAWHIEQIRDFEISGSIKPKTHKELFNLAVLKTIDLKDWLENGDDSAWLTWKRVKKETEMRNLIARELKQKGIGKFSITQEYELANSQRTDIRLDHFMITSPVPIELKILDKDWTGPKLCERLRNQLVGDYLRETTAGCGIFLLVAQNADKKWKIQSKNVGLDGLEEALQNYWYSIAHEWTGIDCIKVIVIDLNKRGKVSDS
ncbi:hypothetical protein GCM10027155_12160 [Acinetobacter apis]|uniref:Uncharacterized protein n=1 Tax=Acinetobacter apis TaxID=1229165 RepID=A0A217EFN2_9GAMM|nr:hypothetical protein [Acinetobacter apis]SNQ29295.1 hypothetical protein SAMN05444584_1242 [Acinetobacter apis]